MEVLLENWDTPCYFIRIANLFIFIPLILDINFLFLMRAWEKNLLAIDEWKCPLKFAPLLEPIYWYVFLTIYNFIYILKQTRACMQMRT